MSALARSAQGDRWSKAQVVLLSPKRSGRCLHRRWPGVENQKSSGVRRASMLGDILAQDVKGAKGIHVNK